MVKWKVKNNVYLFPKDWNIDDVLRFVNTDIKVCPICYKVDVNINHFNSHK
mgnify:CR=1 FL=1